MLIPIRLRHFLAAEVACDVLRLEVAGVIVRLEAGAVLADYASPLAALVVQRAVHHQLAHLPLSQPVGLQAPSIERGLMEATKPMTSSQNVSSCPHSKRHSDAKRRVEQ